MPKFQKRIVDKWIADQIEMELRLLKDQNGYDTVFAVLANVSNLHPENIKRDFPFASRSGCAIVEHDKN